MASITFTATAPNGEQFTRTSPSMPYVSVLMVADLDADNWGPYSWHKTDVAAREAGNSGYHQGKHRTQVVPAVPTAVKGKAEVGDFENFGPHGEAIDALIEAKKAPKARKVAAPVEVEAEAPAEVEVDEAELVAESVGTIANGEVTVEEIAPAKPAKKAPKAKKVAVPTERTLKQALGKAVVEAAMAAALANVPEGMTEVEAKEIVTKWMSYIPVPKEA